MKILLALTLPLALLFAQPTLAQESHDHHASHHEAGELVIPEDHVRWEPDAPLREGMGRVHVAVRGLVHGTTTEADDIVQAANDVNEAIAYMFANCSLDPEPDAALHQILARLMNGASKLKDNPADTEPVGPMHSALHDYLRLFDDPDFHGGEDQHEHH